MAAPTVNLVLTNPPSAMAPAVVNCHIGLYANENIRSAAGQWTAETGSEYSRPLSTLPGAPATLYNVKLYEKWVDRDLNTGFRWISSLPHTTEFWVELAAGGDPGLWPFLPQSWNDEGPLLKQGGATLNYQLPEDMGTSQWGWGAHPADPIAFRTAYARMSDSADPDTKVMTLTYWPLMTEGTAGSLAAGQWAISAGKLFVRLRDGADPDSKASGWLLISYDMSQTGVTGEQERFDLNTVRWKLTRTGGLTDWALRYRKVTDPRRTATTVSLATEDVEGYGVSLILSAGTYYFTCTVTNQNGESTSVDSAEFTVAADTRTKKTVKAAGGDYTSIAAAITGLGATDNIWLECEAGGSETVTAALAFVRPNWFVSVASNGVYTLNTSFTGDKVTFSSAATRCVIDGLTVTPSAAVTIGSVFRFNGCTHVGIANCVINGTAAGNRLAAHYLFDDNPQYLAIINCSGGAGNYTMVKQGGDIGVFDLTVAGGDFASNPDDNSIIRINGLHRSTFLYTKMDATAGTDNGIRLPGNCNNVYVHGCRGLHCDVRLGTVPGDNSAPYRCRVNACHFTTVAQEMFLNFDSCGYFSCVMENNGAGGGITTQPNPRQPMWNGSVIGCTCVNTNNNQWGLFFDRFDTLTDGFHVKGFRFHGNLNTYNSGATYPSSNQMAVRQKAQCGAASLTIDQNQWTDPASFGLAANRLCRLEGTGDQSLTDWNALAGHGTDFAVSTTLGAGFVPASTQAITTPAGVHRDIWGNLRSLNAVAGAAVAADPGPTAEPATGGAVAGISSSSRAISMRRLVRPPLTTAR